MFKCTKNTDGSKQKVQMERRVDKDYNIFLSYYNIKYNIIITLLNIITLHHIFFKEHLSVTPEKNKKQPS